MVCFCLILLMTFCKGLKNFITFINGKYLAVMMLSMLICYFCSFCLCLLLNSFQLLLFLIDLLLSSILFIYWNSQHHIETDRHSSIKWARMKPRVWKSIQVSLTGLVGAQGLGPPSAAFPGSLARRWIASREQSSLGSSQCSHRRLTLCLVADPLLPAP